MIPFFLDTIYHYIIYAGEEKGSLRLADAQPSLQATSSRVVDGVRGRLVSWLLRLYFGVQMSHACIISAYGFRHFGVLYCCDWSPP